MRVSAAWPLKIIFIILTQPITHHTPPVDYRYVQFRNQPVFGRGKGNSSTPVLSFSTSHIPIPICNVVTKKTTLSTVRQSRGRSETQNHRSRAIKRRYTLNTIKWAKWKIVVVRTLCIPSHSLLVGRSEFPIFHYALKPSARRFRPP